MSLMRFFRRRGADAELEREMAFFLEEETAENVARGMTEEEARRRARIKLGNAQKVRESLWTQNGIPNLEDLWRDFRYSFRALIRNRVVTLVAILSIGLGIGSNTTIFSLVSRFLLRPAPVGDPGTLLSLQIAHDNDRCCNSFSWPQYTEVREQAKVFSDVAAYYDLIRPRSAEAGSRSGCGARA